MSIDVKILASGSRANSTIIQCGNTTIGVDMGLSMKEFNRRATMVDVDINSIDAMLITHEHIDHIKGLAVMCKSLKTPIISNEKTLDNIPNICANRSDINNFESGFYIKDVFVQPIRISHDTVYPMGYSMYYKGEQLTIVTDTGCINNAIYKQLLTSNIILIESNHDEILVGQSPYPYSVKQRILSNVGHLSNNTTAETLAQLATSGIHRKVALCHLSDTNNTHEIAKKCTLDKLSALGVDCIDLHIASQYIPSILI